MREQLEHMPYGKLRDGDSFSFADSLGLSWVRCRGGFRPGLGGQIHTTRPHVPVVRRTWVAP